MTSRLLICILFVIAPLLAWAQDAIESLPVEEMKNIVPLVQAGHSGYLNFVAFTPDEKIVVSGSTTKIILWDVAKGNIIMEHQTGASSALSQDGKILFTANNDDNNIGFLRDLLTGETKMRIELESPHEPVSCSAFHPQGHLLATGHGSYNSTVDSTVRLWDVSTGKLVSEYMGHSKHVKRILFSRDGNSIVSASEDNTAILWNTNTGKKMIVFQNAGEINDIALSPDMKTLAISGNRQEKWGTTLWDVKTQSEKGFISKTSSLSFSPDGRSLAIGEEIYNLDSREKTKTLVGHVRSIGKCAFSPSGRYYLTGSYDSTAILWDSENGKMINRFGRPSENYGNYLADIRRDGKVVAVLSNSGILRFFEVKTGFLLWKIDGLSKKSTAIKFSVDGQWLLTASKKDGVQVWNADSGNLERAFKEAEMEINAAAINSDNTWVVYGGSGGDSDITVRDLRTGRIVKKLERFSVGVIYGLCFHPKKNVVAIASSEGLATWDLDQASSLQNYDDQECSSVDFSPNGDLLTAGANNLTVVFDFISREKRFSHENESGSIKKVAFSPNENILASADNKGNLFIYDAKTGRVVRDRKYHQFGAQSLAFDDQDRLMTADNSAVQLWDSTTMLPMRRFGEYFMPYLQHAAIDQVADKLYLGANGGLVYTWDLKEGRVVHTNGILKSCYGMSYCSGTNELTICDFHNVAVIDTKRSGISDFYYGEPDGFKHFNRVVLSPSGNELAGFTYLDETKNKAFVFDRSTRRMIAETEIVHKEKEWISTFEWNSELEILFRLRRKTTDPEKEDYLSTDCRWDVLKNTINRDNEIEYRPKTTEIRTFDGISLMAWHDNSKTAMTVDGKLFRIIDGSARFFNDTGEEICSLYAFNAGKDWLVLTPQGLFDGTPGGRRMVSYRVGSGLNVQPVESFFQDFYYPGLLAAIWKGERPMPSTQLKEQLPPDIKFLAPVKSGEVNAETASFEVLVTDMGGGVKEPHVTLNGVGVRVRTEPVSSGKTLRWKFSLPLVEGENTVLVHSATADGQIACQSMPMVLHNRQHETATPALFMLAIGVSDYADGNENDLPSARADAEVLAEVFRRRGTEFYGAEKVNVKTLLDSQATAEGIKAAMQRIADTAKPEDVFILSLAGHGATVGSLYHFLPYDFKFEGDTTDNLVKKQGIAHDVLQDWINAVPAMKRVLIYDTCQSGAVVTRGGMEHRKAMESLRKMTGSYTIAAAVGKEVATELPDVGHGALTYSLLAGLGEAKKGILQRRNAIGGDGSVRVRDWLTFAMDEVPNLTRASFGTEQRVVFSAGEYNFPLLGDPKAKP